MAEECLKFAMDLSGLLLLYSSLGDAEGISKLATLAKEQGKNNVAFLCLFMLGRLEESLELLVERYFLAYLKYEMKKKNCAVIVIDVLKYALCSNRIPEAALMARSYLPSKVSEIVAIWRKDLNKVIVYVFTAYFNTPGLVQKFPNGLDDMNFRCNNSYKRHSSLFICVFMCIYFAVVYHQFI